MKKIIEVTQFHTCFLVHCKKNPNMPENIPSEIKKKVKTIYLNKTFCSQLVMMECKTEVKRVKQISKSRKTYLFQGHSERSKHWFDLDIDWIEYYFMTREPEFFKRLFRRNI